MALVVIAIAVLVLFVWLAVGFVFALIIGPFLVFSTPPDRGEVAKANRERER